MTVAQLADVKLLLNLEDGAMAGRGQTCEAGFTRLEEHFLMVELSRSEKPVASAPSLYSLTGDENNRSSDHAHLCTYWQFLLTTGVCGHDASGIHSGDTAMPGRAACLVGHRGIAAQMIRFQDNAYQRESIP